MRQLPETFQFLRGIDVHHLYNHVLHVFRNNPLLLEFKEVLPFRRSTFDVCLGGQRSLRIGWLAREARCLTPRQALRGGI